jgi:hypothetical protein
MEQGGIPQRINSGRIRVQALSATYDQLVGERKRLGGQ